MNDRFWAWFDEFANPYTPLLRELSSRFGTEFQMVHTGGSCMAVEAVLEGFVLMITDAADVLSWWDERQAALRNGEPLGYAVGVYRLETYEHEGKQYTGIDSSEAVGWASSPQADSPEKLTRLIELAISSIGQPVTFDHVPDAALEVTQ